MKKSKKMKFVLTLPFMIPTWALAGEGTGALPLVDTGVTSWMLTSTALVLLMIPGLAMFYGGLVRSKNVLGTMMHSFIAMGIMTILWVVCGYSMCFGPNVLGGLFGWNPDYVFLSGIDDSVMSSGIPEYVFSMFQGKFAIIAPALISGAIAERISFKSYCLFIVLWGLFVYNPICHWVWASDGLIFNMGVKGAIDFAGGTVVHISAGVSGLIAAIFLGARSQNSTDKFVPNNLVMTMTGAGLLWVGWFGFNAGSSVASNLDTARALAMTQIAAAAGAIGWAFVEFFHKKKVTGVGFACGILAGLVAITPAAGAIKPASSVFLGILAAVACYYAIVLIGRFKLDDTLDVFGIHGVAAIIGAIGLTFFIRDSWMESAALASPNGIWTVWEQLNIQVVAVLIAIAYSALVTFLILFLLKKTVGLRTSTEKEHSGLDEAYHGEKGYGMVLS